MFFIWNILIQIVTSGYINVNILTKYYVSSVVHSIHPIKCYKFEMQQFNVHIILSNEEFVDIKEAKIQSKPSNMIWAPSDLIPIKKENPIH